MLITNNGVTRAAVSNLPRARIHSDVLAKNLVNPFSVHRAVYSAGKHLSRLVYHKLRPEALRQEALKVTEHLCFPFVEVILPKGGQAVLI